MIHEKKTLPEYFWRIISDDKMFEFRKNDCNYKEGDYLILKEWDNGKFTGYEVFTKITYVLENFEGLEKGYCVLGIKVLDTNVRDGGIWDYD